MTRRMPITWGSYNAAHQSGYAPASYSAPVRRRLADPSPRHRRPRRSLWRRWTRPVTSAQAVRTGWVLLAVGLLIVAFALGVWVGGSIRFDVVTQASAL